MSVHSGPAGIPHAGSTKTMRLRLYKQSLFNAGRPNAGEKRQLTRVSQFVVVAWEARRSKQYSADVVRM